MYPLVKLSVCLLCVNNAVIVQPIFSLTLMINGFHINLLAPTFFSLAFIDRHQLYWLMCNLNINSIMKSSHVKSLRMFPLIFYVEYLFAVKLNDVFFCDFKVRRRKKNMQPEHE